MLTPKHTAWIAMATLVACAGCSRGTERRIPPFTAHYANFSLEVPRRPDLDKVLRTGEDVELVICNRSRETPPPQLCEGLMGPVVNKFGLRASISATRPDERFEFLKERPTNAEPPPSEPLIEVVNAPPAEDRFKGGEATRLASFGVLDQDAPLTTTANGWPMARCAENPGRARYCAVGFLIKGVVVEFTVFAERGVPLDQRQIWNLASAVDAKLRALSRPKA